jgi:antitoxin VapB
VNEHEPSKAREASLFRSNRSQAVRIPRDLAFPDGVTKVTVTPVEGGGLLIEAAPKPTWTEYFENGPFVDDDFLADREQGAAPERELFD